MKITIDYNIETGIFSIENEKECYTEHSGSSYLRIKIPDKGQIGTIFTPLFDGEFNRLEITINSNARHFKST